MMIGCTPKYEISANAIVRVSLAVASSLQNEWAWSFVRYVGRVSAHNLVLFK